MFMGVNGNKSWIGLHVLFHRPATRCGKQNLCLIFYLFQLPIAAVIALKCINGKPSGRRKKKRTHSPRSLGLFLPSIITLDHK